MTPGQLEAIRLQLGKTQEAMAKLLQCDFVSYKRYATGARPVPRYIARCATALSYLAKSHLLDKFEKTL